MVKLLRRGSWGAMLLLMVAGMANRVAATQADGLEHTLTAGASRAWMTGTADACEGAESFTFATDHRLSISRCVGNRLVVAQHTWWLRVRDGAASLTISDLGTFDLTEIGSGVLPGSRGMRLQAKADRRSAPIELLSLPD